MNFTNNKTELKNNTMKKSNLISLEFLSMCAKVAEQTDSNDQFQKLNNSF